MTVRVGWMKFISAWLIYLPVLHKQNLKLMVDYFEYDTGAYFLLKFAHYTDTLKISRRILTALTPEHKKKETTELPVVGIDNSKSKGAVLSSELICL